MASEPKVPYVTPEAYLELERQASHKSEYYRGQVVAMTGASRKHNLLVGNTFAALHRQLRHRPCESYASNMRVRVSATGLYTYPDVAVVCDTPEFEDRHVDTL
jgi:Uma2 family endonuclease